MISWLEVLVLSIVQGITEFLPVSSSAHLVFVPKILGWEDQGLAFDIAMHFGTLFAVVIYFRREIIAIVRDFVLSLLKRETIGESKLGWAIIVAVLPAGLAGFLFHDYIALYARSPIYIAIGSIVFGIVLYFADKMSGNKTEINMTLYFAFIIGLAQVLSLMPGVSRSGITLTAALFLGFSRVSAARFSFLISIPIILAATLLEGYTLINSDNLVEWSKLLGAVLFSFISGYLCIYTFLAIISRWSMTPFVIYRILLGILLLAVFL